ncbi:MAG: EexN family lipoprotein [Acetobacteraceae bacterium]|nr:EexN family lipoprotein [Acetobacteraceae bacterium]
MMVRHARHAATAVVLLALAAGAAGAQPPPRGGSDATAPPASPPRTVTWYADNPQARARVELACLDDPGRLNRHPDCINARQAGVELALRDARWRNGTLNPDDPAFWAARPEARQAQLTMCRNSPGIQNCAAARRSLEAEAGLARR